MNDENDRGETWYEYDAVCYELLHLKRKLQAMEMDVATEANMDFINIIKSIKTYLKKHCPHEFQTDYIDLPLQERGMTICYCVLCETNKDEIK